MDAFWLLIVMLRLYANLLMKCLHPKIFQIKQDNAISHLKRGKIMHQAPKVSFDRWDNKNCVYTLLNFRNKYRRFYFKKIVYVIRV